MKVQISEQKLEAIASIPDSGIVRPGNIPVTVYLQEARNLYNWCQADREALTANGLDWSFVDDIPAREAALRNAQSAWAAARRSNEEAERAWLEKAPRGVQLRNDLLRSIKFAFAKNQAVKGSFASIKKSGAYAGVIQNLNDLSVIGKGNEEILKRIRFDMSKLDLAAVTASEMAALLGQVTTERAFSNGAMKYRDQAFTHLKEAVDEVKSFGRFLFYNDGSRIKGYSSEYKRRYRKKLESQKSTEEKPANQ